MELEYKQLSLSIANFQEVIWSYFKKFGRKFSWRQTTNPYYIVVSEIMLQQTQTFRVEGKFEQFIARFPDFKSLADAPLRDILAAWQGLGYNRRAMALQKTAQLVVADFDGILPNDPEVLVNFPGIGKATAASICAFAYNKPTVFIETNIRAVFIHFFFQGKSAVHDNELLPIVMQAVDKENPRLWYYALMDYGVMLKKKFLNPSKKSKHHTMQSKFEGSDRQIRGMILKILTQNQSAIYTDFITSINRDEERIKSILVDLEREGFVISKKNIYQIPL